MGQYAKIEAQNMADVISWIRAVLTGWGWVVTTDEVNETYNRTIWKATKDGAGHRFCAVYNGKFPFAVTKGGSYDGSWQADADQHDPYNKQYGIYEAAIGMQNMLYTGGGYYLIAPHLTFPCRGFVFETSDHSLLLAFEAEKGRWQNLYSGFANKSLTGAWDGGMIMTGCTSPAQGWEGTEDNGFMMPNGFSSTVNHYPMATLCSHNGYLISPRVYGSGAFIPTSWPGGDLTVNYYNNVQYEYYFPVKRKEGEVYQASKEGLLINSIGQTQLVGLPTLFPMTMRFKTIFGAYLSDIWCCPMQTCQPGEELWMGVQKYITIPVWKYDPAALGLAIRVN